MKIFGEIFKRLVVPPGNIRSGSYCAVFLLDFKFFFKKIRLKLKKNSKFKKVLDFTFFLL